MLIVPSFFSPRKTIELGTTGTAGFFTALATCAHKTESEMVAEVSGRSSHQIASGVIEVMFAAEHVDVTCIACVGDACEDAESAFQ